MTGAPGHRRLVRTGMAGRRRKQRNGFVLALSWPQAMVEMMNSNVALHGVTVLMLASTAGLAAGAADPTVIPRPAAVTEQAGRFTLRPGACASVPRDATALYLRTLSDAAGVPLRPATAVAPCAVQFLPAATAGAAQPSGEGYHLRVAPETAIVSAATPAGHFHGLQTLAQLLRGAPREGGGCVLPCMEIADAPRFGWRGYMLDESRHFSGKAAVLRLLDAMAEAKLNRFHWHLTDSPGWRIEIKAYPRLTDIGARGSETDRRPDAPRQFYTQDEIRGIVAYARERHITIVPEIDMPGHADAAVLAYPELDGGGFLQKGRTDKWPRFTFHPAKAETLAFLDTVLKEVAGLFPDAGVIHFGGDEVHFGWQKWPDLPGVKSLMAKEGLKDLAGVETWFNRRMAGVINGLGFKTAGWDEIAARDLPRDKTVIFWWRHDKPQILRQALDAGYPVVLCPRRPCYFDFVQHDSHKVGRRWGGFNPIEDVYAFPAALQLSADDEAKVLGMQACLWTETTVTQERRDFMTWPRLLALAEAAWTPEARKDLASFRSRLPAGLARLKALGLGAFDPAANTAEITDEQAGKPKAHLD
ncbi:MAG: beta-N-acetylhexosaminidase [Lentisphaerae bacterium]|nr:beta-N-acetylhexosaminidase [Lentisphaerota bacterium]